MDVYFVVGLALVYADRHVSLQSSDVSITGKIQVTTAELLLSYLSIVQVFELLYLNAQQPFTARHLHAQKH